MQFFFWVIGLYVGADDGYVIVLLADSVNATYHHDVNVGLSTRLALRNDYLKTRHFLRVFKRVVQNADCTHDFAYQLHSVLKSGIECVAWTADDHIGLCQLAIFLDSDDLAFFEDNFLDIGVKHESASVHSAHATEAFWDPA